MMEGFGVHTFRLVERARARRASSSSTGSRCSACTRCCGTRRRRSPARTRTSTAATCGRRSRAANFPEWELGLQIIEEKDEHTFDFDLLDPTKLIPEELVPVQRVGKLTLNRNPDNFFAETEQVAFHLGHVVPGIDFTNDPLLQGRLFSYTDTQLIRLGGPNFHEIPINRPVAPVHNNQRDGFMRQTINRRPGRATSPTRWAAAARSRPRPTAGGFVSYPEAIERSEGPRRAARASSTTSARRRCSGTASPTPEQEHIVEALRFELGKVDDPGDPRADGRACSPRSTRIWPDAWRKASAWPSRRGGRPLEPERARRRDPKDFQPATVQAADRPVAGAEHGRHGQGHGQDPQGRHPRRRRRGCDRGRAACSASLKAAGAQSKVVAPRLGDLTGARGQAVPVDWSLLTAGSVLFDAVYVPGGDKSAEALAAEAAAVLFVREAYKHCKAIAASGAGVGLLKAAGIIEGPPRPLPQPLRRRGKTASGGDDEASSWGPTSSSTGSHRASSGLLPSIGTGAARRRPNECRPESRPPSSARSHGELAGKEHQMDRDNVVVYTAWPVSWSAIWVGTLAALAVGLIIGLIGTAVGAHEASRYVDWKKVHLIGLVFSVAGAFFAFVVGGWVAARIAGILRSETAVLHGSIVWLAGAAPVARPRRLRRGRAIRRLVRRARGRPGVGRGGSARRPGDRKDNAQHRRRLRRRLAHRLDRVGHRRLDGARASP